jgi:hypothetical protein
VEKSSLILRRGKVVFLLMWRDVETVCHCKGNLCIASYASLTDAPFLSAERGCRGFRPRTVSSVKLLITLYFTQYTRDSFVMNVSSISFISPTLYHVVLLNFEHARGPNSLKQKKLYATVKVNV